MHPPYQQVESITDIYRIGVIRAAPHALPVLAGSHGEVPANHALISLVCRAPAQAFGVAALAPRVAGLAGRLAHPLAVLAVPAEVPLEILCPRRVRALHGVVAGGRGLVPGAQRTLVLGLQAPDVVLAVLVGNQVPVYRVDEAQGGVFVYSHQTARDVSQRVQGDLLQARHFENDQGVGEKQRLPAYHGQVREYAAQASQAVHSVQQEVVRDLRELGEGYVGEAAVVEIVEEQDLNESFHHATAPQPVERAQGVSDVDTRAYWNKASKSVR